MNTFICYPKCSTCKKAQKYLEEKINTFNQTDYINNIYVVIEREDYYEDYKNLSKEELKKYFEKAGLEIEE